MADLLHAVAGVMKGPRGLQPMSEENDMQNGVGSNDIVDNWSTTSHSEIRQRILLQESSVCFWESMVAP